jgi:hypothetical protein
MTAPNKDTAALLRDLYQIAHMQAGLSKQDMTLQLDWAKLRLRLNDALVREGIKVPELPEVQAAQGES